MALPPLESRETWRVLETVTVSSLLLLRILFRSLFSLLTGAYFFSNAKCVRFLL